MFDRDAEWASLAAFAAHQSPDVRLGVVSGRRRQGKTYLLTSLADSVEALYFAASEATEADSLRQFGEALGRYAGAAAAYQLPTWEDALSALLATAGDRLVIIDEFPYLIRASPSLPSLLQRLLDPGGSVRRQGMTRLILCGSAMAVMGDLLSGTAPLRGRASMELIVPPLGYRDAAAFWGIVDPRLAVLVNAVVGGTPAYRREFTAGDAPAGIDDFDEWVLRTVLSPESPLFREARYLLAEESEIRDTALYHAVLGAIAVGNSSRGGIANYIGRRSTDIAHPLTVLEDCQLITREPDAFRSGRGRYRIVEPLITFYEAVMRPAWTRLERRQARRAWAEAKPRFQAQVVGPHFEALCREHALDAPDDLFGGLSGEVMSGTVADPAHRTQIELDVVVFGLPDQAGARRILAIGEAKWGERVTTRHVERLRRARALLVAKGYDAVGARLVCYGAGGFDDDVVRAAGGGGGEIVLRGLADLF
ncbi:ATP-binding protein [Natronosporangium hydrolyticum]|uniref:ATP-binding protein n=1 Tax=Natronosporangium hydrolyticum TaxID=2811111 RepID=A0A895YTP3_9ACTN|nr:ATP-binding protein [Natronosporangium hydrolyticum]